jgi:metal-responsive CopG/Arc/MetJ family transcriptional regulator
LIFCVETTVIPWYAYDMTAKKIAISLSDEALRAVDRYAKAEGITRSAWFERAARRAKRREAAQRALQELASTGMKPSSTATVERLRRELAKG